MVNKQFIIERLSEPSTWRGIIMILTAAGVQIQPQMMELIVSVGMAVAGVVGVATADKKSQNAETTEG